MNSPPSDRDPMLHRPSLWEHVGLDSNFDSLHQRFRSDAQQSLDAYQSNRNNQNAYGLVVAYARLMRMGVDIETSASNESRDDVSQTLLRIANIIDALQPADRQRVVDQFDRDRWLADARQLSERLESNDSLSVTDEAVDLLRRLDDAGLVIAIMQPSASATDQAIVLDDCLTWVEDHFDDFYEAMPWAIGVAETIRISGQSELLCLNATAEKFMLWTEQFSIDLGERESVFEDFQSAGSANTATKAKLKVDDFRNVSANAQTLSLAAGSESSEQVRERIESLPVTSAAVKTVDIGSDGVFTIQRINEGLRCHFLAGVASQPPKVTASSNTGKGGNLNWNPLPSGDSFQTDVFRADQIVVTAISKEVTIGLIGND